LDTEFAYKWSGHSRQSSSRDIVVKFFKAGPGLGDAVCRRIRENGTELAINSTLPVWAIRGRWMKNCVSFSARVFFCQPSFFGLRSAKDLFLV
jgi:hypothetical protein